MIWIDRAVAELDGGELSSYALELFDGAVNAAARSGAAGLTLDVDLGQGDRA